MLPSSRAENTHLKATGSGKTTWRRPGPGDSAGGVLSTDREPSNLGAPDMGGVTLSLGAVEFTRVELRWAASLVCARSSSLCARPSEGATRKDIVPRFYFPRGPSQYYNLACDKCDCDCMCIVGLKHRRDEACILRRQLSDGQAHSRSVDSQPDFISSARMAEDAMRSP